MKIHTYIYYILSTHTYMMKLSIRTLDQKTITVEMNAKENVLQLKKHLVSLPQINNTVESMQLIYAGRIMEDALPLTHYNIAESKFIVLMNKKNPSPASAEEPQPETQQQQQQLPQGQTAPLAATPVDAPPAAVDEQRVRDLISMGYEEQDVRAALRASFNHPERAIEYLITGLPTVNDRTLATTRNTDNATAATGAEGDLVSETAERLQYLATDPRFAHVRNLIRQNPELLELVLAHLSESDPVTFEAIRSHQQEFISMLNETNTATNLSLPLSTDEEAAIERLMGLGFERETVVQVYLACNKNEELAADMLFSQSEDEDE